MAAPIHVKVKGKWKKVELPSSAFSEEGFENIVALEELHDYELSNVFPLEINDDDDDDDDEFSEFKSELPQIKTPAVVEKKLSYKEKQKIRNKEKKKKKKEKLKKNKEDQLILKTESDTVIYSNSEVPDVKTASKRKAGDTDLKENKKKRKKQKKKSENYNAQNILPETLPPLQQYPPEMEAWKNLFVPNPVLWALKDEGFMSPTTIQALSIPHAIRDRLDIVGAAETGSGKTLAFCVPILHHVLNVQTVQDSLIEQTHSLQDTQKYISQNETDSDSNIDILQPEFNPEEDWGDSDNIDEENNSDEIDDSDDVDNDDVDSGVDNGSDEDGDYDNPPTEEDIEELGENEVGCVRVVHNIVLDPTPQTVNTDKPLIGLILEPTRELAIQVKNHLLKAAKYINVKIATVVGGMAPQKQRRILSQCPEIIIATPGRLWELLQEGDQHLIKIPSVKVLVVDEADRMVEKGHFEELTKLFEFMKDNHEARLKRQTLVFSATLTMIHKGPSRKMKKKKKALIPDDKLDLLMYQIGIKDKKKIVDLTTKTGTAENLTEARINCPKDEKDLYLYYFRRQYPGRTLVFANSKDCLRRLVSIFTELGCKPLSLHADMHQKQRLKNLEKFSASNDGFLLASDVAARGLDIPNVQHVIHYQVPRTIENYVHRSGRTARATKEGLSVMLISQDDVRNYRKIISTLNRDEELPVFPVEYQYIPTLKSQLRLALEIDKLHHRFMKVKRQNDWFSKAAEEMEIDIKDEKLLVDIGDNEEQRQHAKKLVNMRADLLQALKQPLAPRTFSGKYPTKMGKLVTLHDAASKADAITVMKKDKDVQRPMIEKIALNPKIRKVKVKRQKEKKKNRKSKVKNKS